MKPQQTNEVEIQNYFSNILSDERKSGTKALSRIIIYIIRQHVVTIPPTHNDFSFEVTNYY